MLCCSTQWACAKLCISKSRQIDVCFGCSCRNCFEVDLQHSGLVSAHGQNSPLTLEGSCIIMFLYDTIKTKNTQHIDRLPTQTRSSAHAHFQCFQPLRRNLSPVQPWSRPWLHCAGEDIRLHLPSKGTHDTGGVALTVHSLFHCEAQFGSQLGESASSVAGHNGALFAKYLAKSHECFCFEFARSNL